MINVKGMTNGAIPSPPHVIAARGGQPDRSTMERSTPTLSTIAFAASPTLLVRIEKMAYTPTKPMPTSSADLSACAGGVLKISPTTKRMMGSMTVGPNPRVKSFPVLDTVIQSLGEVIHEKITPWIISLILARRASSNPGDQRRSPSQGRVRDIKLIGDLGCCNNEVGSAGSGVLHRGDVRLLVIAFDTVRFEEAGDAFGHFGGCGDAGCISERIFTSWPWLIVFPYLLWGSCRVH